MSTGELLSIHPSELKFPFELKKQSSCSMQLSNKTGKYVAFKVKTTNPRKYCVRPNTGIVLPGASCYVTVTMQAQKDAPSDMQCRDMFLFLSVLAPKGATTKDITPELFNKDDDKVVEESKLRVVYIPASTGELLSIHPSELKFPFELKKQSSCSMQLSNKTGKYVAFKVKTTNARKYCVRPNPGIVLPGASCDVTVKMQAQKDAPSDMQCQDKFLFLSVLAPKGSTTKDITPELFNKDGDKVVEELKLRVVYIPANPPSPVPEEGSSPRSSTVESGNMDSPLLGAVSRSLEEPKQKSTDAWSVISRLTDCLFKKIKVD